MKYDVIIVGAGPGGIFAAYELVQKKPQLSVAVFEAGHAPAVPGAGPGGRFQNGRESSSCRQENSRVEIRSADSTARKTEG